MLFFHQTKAVQHLQELGEPIATIIVSLEQPFEASIVPNSMFEPIKRLNVSDRRRRPSARKKTPRKELGSAGPRLADRGGARLACTP